MILVRRLDWIDMIFKFERLSRFWWASAYALTEVLGSIVNADLHLHDLVFPEPEFFQCAEGFQVFNFLFSLSVPDP